MSEMSAFANCMKTLHFAATVRSGFFPLPEAAGGFSGIVSQMLKIVLSSSRVEKRGALWNPD
jgi:hypothetical protein